MKFGVREICNATFKALQSGKLGTMDVVKGQPVLFIDSAKTSTIEGAATTVYATGGRGNTRLLAWEGEKTLTFTVEDALLSDIGFAILSGAGLFVPNEKEVAYVHMTQLDYIEENENGDNIVSIDLENGEVATNAPVFVMGYKNGSITNILEGSLTGNVFTFDSDSTKNTGIKAGDQVFVDFYVQKTAVTEMTIDAENFAGYYYVEGSTLFRRESDGKDLPAEIVFPKVKIQSNFTFSMASTGDPSTFTFTMDAMPAHTFFNRNKKALCAIQVIDDIVTEEERAPVTIASGKLEIAETTVNESGDVETEGIYGPDSLGE